LIGIDKQLGKFFDLAVVDLHFLRKLGEHARFILAGAGFPLYFLLSFTDFLQLGERAGEFLRRRRFFFIIDGLQRIEQTLLLNLNQTQDLFAVIALLLIDLQNAQAAFLTEQANDGDHGHSKENQVNERKSDFEALADFQP